MITAYLQGGLGNQIHQYAFALACARSLGTNVGLDISGFRRDSLRSFNLNLFAICAQVLSGDALAAPNVHECGLPYNQDLVDSIKDGDVLKGYWQSEKYHKSVRRQLLLDFQPRPADFEISPTRIKGRRLYETHMKTLRTIRDAGLELVFVGVRRTDYLQKQDYHGVLPEEYYVRATDPDLIGQRIFDNGFFVIFGDDPDWCESEFIIRKRFPDRSMVMGTFYQTTKDQMGCEDFDIALMAECRHAIIANSSFHYWGAWLHPGPEKGRVVIGPKQWFTSPNEDSRDILPERWLKI